MKTKKHRVTYYLLKEEIDKVTKLAKSRSRDNQGNYNRVTASMIISQLINK